MPTSSCCRAYSLQGTVGPLGRRQPIGLCPLANGAKPLRRTRPENSRPFHTGPGVLLTTTPFGLPRAATLLMREKYTRVPTFQSISFGKANR